MFFFLVRLRISIRIFPFGVYSHEIAHEKEIKPKSSGQVKEKQINNTFKKEGNWGKESTFMFLCNPALLVFPASYLIIIGRHRTMQMCIRFKRGFVLRWHLDSALSTQKSQNRFNHQTRLISLDPPFIPKLVPYWQKRVELLISRKATLYPIYNPTFFLKQQIQRRSCLCSIFLKHFFWTNTIDQT